jgi:hypothetical protein
MKVSNSTPTTLLQQQQYSPYLWSNNTISQSQPILNSSSSLQQKQAFEQSTAMKLHYYVVATSFDQNWYKVNLIFFFC